jgi:serine/threonine-protein kinase
MEYVDGDALSRTLARVGRLTPARTMALVAQAADALHAAHQTGVVHRDVKPGNLLVRPNGTLVLTDFGIARSVGAAQLTAAGSVLGTASYISPEQAMGEQATPLSDVYALGVVAYQCLAGRRPFEGENPLEIAMRHVREAPPPLPPDIPPSVRAIVERAMAKQPHARWPDASAFGAVARRAAAELAAAGPPPPMAPVPPGRPGPVSSPPTGSPVTPAPGTRVLSNTGGRATAPTPPGYLRAQHLPGYLQAPVPPPKPGISPGLLVAIIVAVVLVAICIGAAVAILQQANNGATQSLGSTQSQVLSLASALTDIEGRLGR